MLKFAISLLVLFASPVFAVEVNEALLKGSWKIVSYNGRDYGDDDDRWEYSGNHMSQVSYSANGKIHSMSPSVYYITDGHLLEFDFGILDITALDEKSMSASVSGSDFVFEKISNEVYVKPRAKEKAVSGEVAAAASGMMKVLLETGEENAEALNCSKAVKDAWRFLDQSVLQAEMNYNDGYMTKQELADVGKKVHVVRDGIDVKTCESSEGDVRNFYLCLSNPKNIVLYCADKYKFATSGSK